MKKGLKMNVKIILYAFFLLISVWCISGINYTNFFKKEKESEAKCFVLFFAIIMSYSITNFVIDFLNLSSIL